MTANLQGRLVRQALMISIALNGVVVLISLFGGSPERGSWVVRVADAIAAPPGVIAKWAFQPKEHAVWAFIAAAAESLVCSVVFYAL